ncbi:MAG: hypothetical protein IKJ00_03185 [Clostridia bacterium]|nr:hypothetical protein [Clostridia bacterium]
MKFFTKKCFLRIVLLSIVSSLVLSTFWGCSNKEHSEDSGEATTGVIGTEDASEDNVLDIPEELDFGGQDVIIFAWSDAEKVEFEVEELGTNSINNSVFKRNLAIESELGVNLKFAYTEGNVANVGNYVTAVHTAYASGLGYDILAAHTRSIAQCALMGYMQNLGTIDKESNYLNTSKVWWNDMIVEECTQNGNFYFVTGDASTSFVQMIYSVYFNVDMIEDLKLDSPYELVKNNQWTIDKFIQLCKNVYVDKNENSMVDAQEDIIPFGGASFSYPAMLHGCGIDYVTKNSSEEFVVNNVTSQKMDDLMNKFASCIVTDSWTTDSKVYNGFMSGNVMFYVGAVALGMDAVGKDLNYGCVPCPKYDESQESYYSTVRQPATIFGIMNGAKDMAKVTATLEMYAYQGYKNTTPEIFDVVMSYRASEGPEMTEMLNIIKNTAYFDFARIYVQDGMKICDAPGDCLKEGISWTGWTSTYLESFNKTLKTLSDQYASLSSN